MPRLTLEDVPCPLGCAASDVLVVTGRDRLHGGPGEYRVVRCTACGIMRTDPRPTLDSMGMFYPANYAPHESGRVLPEGFVPSRHGWLRRALRRRRVEDLEPGRMLEIGCASGAFLHRMSRLGWSVAGIEASARAAQRARQLGYPVHVGPLETAPDPARPYDLVVATMVVEHLHQPLQCLQRVGRWVRPGGWLVLSVPDAGSPGFKLFRSRWFALHLPCHLFHFTPRTLRRLLHEAGWTTHHVFWNVSARNLLKSAETVAWDRNAGFIARRLGRWADGPPSPAASALALLLALTRLSGRITVWARPSHG